MNPQIEKYIELILKWNKSINLTGANSRAEIKTHIEDSLAVVPYLNDCNRLLDLGTGGGLPGIPLKITLPDIFVVLVDATRKKTAFLSEVIRELGLKNIEVVWKRVEGDNLLKLLGKFDVVISRATWKLGDFLENSVPYLEDGGKMIAMKANILKEEEKDAEKVINKLGITLWRTVGYEIGGKKRRLMIYKKGG